MASINLAFLAAILPSMLLAANTSATMPGQGSSLVVTPDDAVFRAEFPDFGRYYSLGGPFAGVSLTFEQAIQFGSPGSSYGSEERQQVRVVPLTPFGCYLDQESRNCSESCIQAANIFDNTSTLANCMAFPLITDMIATGKLSNSSQSTAESYGIGGNRSLALLVNSTLSRCFQAYCNQSESCRSDRLGYYIGNSGNLSTNVYQQGNNICQYVEQTVLGDIAGIGVCFMFDYDLQERLTIVLDLCFILATKWHCTCRLDIARDLQDVDFLRLIVRAHLVSWVCSGLQAS